MKKLVFFAWILSLFLCASAAQAETRPGVLAVPDEDIYFTETLYQSESLGLSFWYDAEYLTVEEGMSESGKSLILLPADGNYPYPVSMEMMLPEGEEAFTLRFIEQAYTQMGLDSASDITIGMPENGLAGAQRVSLKNGLLYMFRTLWNDQGQINILLQYPWSKTDDVVLRMLAATLTIEFQ